jgi:O-methyltransferase
MPPMPGLLRNTHSQLRGYARGALARTGYKVVPWPQAGRLQRSHPDLDPAFGALHARCAPFTMTTVERMYALWSAIRHVHAHALDGAIVECGVWRGGSSMLAALTLLQVGDTRRPLLLFDTFAGMSSPTDADVSTNGLRAADAWDTIEGDVEDFVFAYATLEEVRRNMASTGYPEERIAYVQGKVEDTIPSQAPERIALLRLDTDWYESTRHELEHLWSRLVPGGVLIIDDYGEWIGARKAVDEFFADRQDAPLLVRVDATGRVAVKTTGA